VKSLAAAIALVSLCSPAGAAPGDYAVASTEWNGLQRLVELAQARGCPIDAQGDLDWSSLGAGDVPWFVYPRVPIDGDKLRRWLAAGGRAVIADDFGAAGPALEQLDIHKGPAPRIPSPDDAYQRNPSLPIARAQRKDALGAATSTLVANHPSSFLAEGVPPTFAFAGGEALVLELHFGGDAALVAIADPSLLINDMLELDGNRAFAGALLDWSCRQPGDRVRLYTQAFVQRGEPALKLLGGGDRARGPASFNAMIERTNGDLTSKTFADRRTTTILGLSAGLIACFLLLGAFPSRTSMRDRWTRVGRLAQPAPLEQSWDLSGAAAVLREEVALRLSRALGEELGPLEFARTKARTVGARVASRFGAAAGERAEALFSALERLGWRTIIGDGEGDAAPSLVPARRVSRRQLLRLHQLAEALFDDLMRE
jgi:hypothetical protein